MTGIILTGASGKMGKVIQSVVASRDDCEIVAGVDKFNDGSAPFPVYSALSEVKEKADVVIDFSNPSLLDDLLDYGIKTNTALVIATTGFDINITFLFIILLFCFCFYIFFHFLIVTIWCFTKMMEKLPMNKYFEK